MLTINEINAFPKQRSLFCLCLLWEKLWWIAADLFAVSCEWGLTLWPFLSPHTQPHVWESHLTNRRDTKPHKGSQSDMSEHAHTHLQRGRRCLRSIPVRDEHTPSLALPWATRLCSNYCIDPIRAHTDPDAFTTPWIHISLISQIYSEVIWELCSNYVDVIANRWCVIVGNEGPFWQNLKTLTIIRTLLYLNVYEINL